MHISAYTTYCFKNLQLIQKQYKRYFLCACPQTMQDTFAIAIFRCSLWTNLRFTVKVFIWGAWKHVRPPVAVSIVFEQELPMNVFIACSIFALYVAAPPLWHARGDVFRVYLGRLTFNPLRAVSSISMSMWCSHIPSRQKDSDSFTQQTTITDHISPFGNSSYKTVKFCCRVNVLCQRLNVAFSK